MAGNQVGNHRAHNMCSMISALCYYPSGSAHRDMNLSERGQRFHGTATFSKAVSFPGHIICDFFWIPSQILSLYFLSFSPSFIPLFLLSLSLSQSDQSSVSGEWAALILLWHSHYTLKNCQCFKCIKCVPRSSEFFVKSLRISNHLIHEKKKLKKKKKEAAAVMGPFGEFFAVWPCAKKM